MKILSIDFSYFINYTGNAQFLQESDIVSGQNLSTAMWAEKVKWLSRTRQNRVLNNIKIKQDTINHLKRYIAKSTHVQAYSMEDQFNTISVIKDHINLTSNRLSITTMDKVLDDEDITMDETKNLTINSKNWISYAKRYLGASVNWVNSDKDQGIAQVHMERAKGLKKGESFEGKETNKVREANKVEHRDNKDRDSQIKVISRGGIEEVEEIDEQVCVEEALSRSYDILVLARSGDKSHPMYDNIYEEVKSMLPMHNDRYSKGVYSRKEMFDCMIDDARYDMNHDTNDAYMGKGINLGCMNDMNMDNYDLTLNI